MKLSRLHCARRGSVPRSASVLLPWAQALVADRLRRWWRLALLAVLAGGGWSAAAFGQGFFLFRQPQRPVAELVVPRQDPPKFNDGLLSRATPENTRLVISLSKQRVYLLVGGQVAIDGPVSSGRRGHTTPSGTFPVKEKDLNHYSSLYGDFIDGAGRTIRAGVSARIDSAPSGTHFRGAPMRFFLRLTDGGVGMHVGILPGYPASHGCVRTLPVVAEAIYQRVRVGTVVSVQE